VSIAGYPKDYVGSLEPNSFVYFSQKELLLDRFSNEDGNSLSNATGYPFDGERFE
jgi:hypothetical protein